MGISFSFLLAQRWEGPADIVEGTNPPVRFTSFTLPIAVDQHSRLLFRFPLQGLSSFDDVFVRS